MSTSQDAILDALRSLGGRATTREITLVRYGEFSKSRSVRINAGLRTLARWGLVKRADTIDTGWSGNPSIIWEVVE